MEVYEAGQSIFQGLLKEIRELSRKKPDATMNPGKVKLINRVLVDLLTILKGEPTGKYLEVLDDESLPQISDALLVMVQFESALQAFEDNYFRKIEQFGQRYWITDQFVADAQHTEDDQA